MKKILIKLTKQIKLFLTLFLLSASLSCTGIMTPEYDTLSEPDSAKLTEYKETLENWYNGTFTYKNYQPGNSDTDYMIWNSSALGQDITVRRNYLKDDYSSTYVLSSNYYQLYFKENQKDYFTEIMNTVLKSYSFETTFLYQTEGNYYLNICYVLPESMLEFGDYRLYKYYGDYKVSQSQTQTIHYNDEIVSFFIKTQDRLKTDNDMNYLAHAFTKKINKNCNIRYGTFLLYFADDLDSAKNNPGKETCKAKFKITISEDSDNSNSMTCEKVF